MTKTPFIAIVGPTAVGKSAFAVSLAEEIGGEIVSADSRQVYRHMDIGTAKPPPADRARVPHHLIDILDPDDDFSLAVFLRLANEAIADVQRRGRVRIVVGGTGQYAIALLEKWDVPEVAPDTSLRERLEQRAHDEGGDALYRELTRLDPDAARRIDPRNVRRVVRALEVLGSGQKPSVRPAEAKLFDAFVIGLTLPRSELYARIDARVDAMIAAGWVEEVEALIRMGYGPDLPSMSSLGYGELVRHLKSDWPLAEAVARIKARTHRFARQQYAWFRLTDKRIHWFDAHDEGLAAALTAAKHSAG
jgi:tRNA dimethylallyltransferase